MTVFPDGSKEGLHGHQYTPTVTLELLLPATSQERFHDMIPFADVKSAMKKISDAWDEKILLAKENPFLVIQAASKKSVRFTLCQMEYVLPKAEAIFLPLANITCEELAFHYAEVLKKNLPRFKKGQLKSITVEIEESPGQSASYTWVNA